MKYLIQILTLVLFSSCLQQPEHKEQTLQYQNSRPMARWWWFQSPIKKSDIACQLDWIKAHHFSGVEIAWMYPLSYFDRNTPYDSTLLQQPFLSPEWQDVVNYTTAYAGSTGLKCDFTFGTGWPFAGTWVRPGDGTKIYGDSDFVQKMRFGWEYPKWGRVMDHLSKGALERYAYPVGRALHNAIGNRHPALFCDSWEIKMNATNKLWTHGFEKAFQTRYGYDIIPFMEDSLDNYPDVRYDYMKLVSDMVIDSFYRPYTSLCHQLNAVARVQCLASPAEPVSAYTFVDIPESEAMLNNPSYSRIVSSAACLSAKKEVSCETFTCMYGFPDTYMDTEQVADLKMVADALFAQGVNQIFWHGIPYNKAGRHDQRFFATVNAGPGGELEPQLKPFNDYLGRVSEIMKKGRSYSDIACYLPWEDHVMAGPYPDSLQRHWVWGQYEMRYVQMPGVLKGHHPLWISGPLLEKVRVNDDHDMLIGDAIFHSLYIDAQYIDKQALLELLRLAEDGLVMCIRKRPLEPGHLKNKDYDHLVNRLFACPGVDTAFHPVGPPLIIGQDIPDYWCRQEEDTLWIFVANPKTSGMGYPVRPGRFNQSDTIYRQLTIMAWGQQYKLQLGFAQNESHLLKIVQGQDLEVLPLHYSPPKQVALTPRIVKKNF